MSLNEDLIKLETEIERLRREYDQFFSGQLKTEPLGTRRIVHDLLALYLNRPIQNSQSAFRFRNLVARYTTLGELWGRKLREREEGISIGRPTGRRAGPPSPPPAPASPPAAAEQAAAPEPALVGAPAAAPEDPVSRLYASYVEALRKTGESVKVEPGSFRRMVLRQMQKIKETHACGSVSFKITVEDGKAKLKAVIRT